MRGNEGTNRMFASTARRGGYQSPLMGAVVLALWGFLSLGVIARVTVPLSTLVTAPDGADAVSSVQPNESASRQAASLVSRPRALPQRDRSLTDTESAAMFACGACQDCLEEIGRVSNATLGR